MHYSLYIYIYIYSILRYMFRRVLVILRETMAESNVVKHSQTRCKPQHATGTESSLNRRVCKMCLYAQNQSCTALKTRVKIMFVVLNLCLLIVFTLIGCMYLTILYLSACIVLCRGLPENGETFRRNK